MILGIFGLYDFEVFFKFYCNFMDARNPMHIWYPKGTYARVVLRITLIMALIMGSFTLTMMLLQFLDIIPTY